MPGARLLGPSARPALEHPRARAVAFGFCLVLVFALALGLRLYRVDEPYTEVNPARQYRSALIARALYYQGLTSVAEWQRQVAAINSHREGLHEAPIMELVSAAAYRLSGGEVLWVPRLLSILAWMLGGVFLFRLASAMGDRVGALFATAFYLLVPFGVAISRTFQPEALLVMSVLGSLLATWRYHNGPSRRRFVVAAVVASLAILVKPTGTYTVMLAYLLPVLAARGLRATLASPAPYLFGLIGVAPSVAYYAYGLSAGSLLGTENTLTPQFLASPGFWVGVVALTGRAVGYVPLVVALLGLFLYPPQPHRAFLLGAWAGFALLALTFAYAMSTHDYYHLLLIPLVAISVAPACGLLVRQLLLRNERSRLGLSGVAASLALGVLLAAASYVGERGRIVHPEFLQDVRVAPLIGQEVGHSTNTILYTRMATGKAVQYHGHLSGYSWPKSGGERAYRAELEQLVRGQGAPRGLDFVGEPLYFIITDPAAYERDAALRALIADRFTPFRLTPQYLIFRYRG